MKKVIYSFFALILIASAGCKKDFFDINDNPNNPTEEAITPNLILPSVLHQTAKKMGTSYDYSAHWMGYWARSGTYGPSNPLENYDLTTTYERDEWVNGSTAAADPTMSWYNIMMDADVMQKKAEASGETMYVGIAKVIKSIGFMYLVDQYGNVPYTEAFKGTAIITPKYDKGQDIYNDLLIQLEEAKAIFASADPLKNPGIGMADIMFGERPPVKYDFNTQVRMWRKLANTQHLKLLLRQSELFGGTAPAAEIAKITADGSGFLGSGETGQVNPGYSVAANQQNPFYNTYLKDYNGTLVDNFNRANNYILNKFINRNDIRYQYVFSAAQTPIGGNTYFGYDFGFVSSDPDQPKAANSSNVAGPGLAKSSTQPQWLFTSVESMFLQAEAVQRGWISGDVTTALSAAIRESYVWLNVNGSAAAATTAANTYIAENAPATTVQGVVMEKYYSLIGINNFEAWVDYRRVGVPTDLPLSQSPSRNGRGIPVRLLYPQEEYSYNAANVAAEGTVNAQTSKVFWDK